MAEKDMLVGCVDNFQTSHKLDKGELFIELEGAADDIVMGEDAQVISDKFFSKLDAALKAKAA